MRSNVLRTGGLALAIVTLAYSISACSSTKSIVKDTEVLNSTETSNEEANNQEASNKEKYVENSKSEAVEKSKKLDSKKVTGKEIDKYWDIAGVKLTLTDDNWIDTTPQTDRFVCKQFTVADGKNKDAVIQVVVAKSGYPNFTVSKYAKKYGDEYQSENILLDDNSSAVLYSWTDKESGQVIEKVVCWPFKAEAEISLVYNINNCDEKALNNMVRGINTKDANIESGVYHENESLSEVRKKTTKDASIGSTRVNANAVELEDKNSSLDNTS